MAFQKLLNLKNRQKESLDSIQRHIADNGGEVSIMELIHDAIDIFINQYSDAAVKRYSPTFYDKKGDK